MLDAISIYWLTNTGTSSSRSYWEGAQAGGGPFDAFDIPTVPVAVTVFPAEIYRAPKSWGEKSFGNLIYWNRSEEHTSELQSLMRISYAVFCLKKKIHIKNTIRTTICINNREMYICSILYRDTKLK